MKSTLVSAALALTASAHRCRMDRYSTNVAGVCSGGLYKLGDQTENDACSKVHTNSCYGRPQDATGDAGCRLVITAGSGCDPNKGIVAELPCTGDPRAWAGEEHSYIVICD
ncbi:hypothetical protein GGR51DRAFT_296995 [Nemania sp. FL0031]|nr:hypothetical protein GGR51DRAFT_296995 [Nemania sp. FL0031]